MKRFLALVLALITLFSLTPAVLADSVGYIDTVPYDSLPNPGNDVHYYLLLCQDTWTDKSKDLGNTDGIVLAILDRRAHRVMLVSFIRDAMVKRPDGKASRINFIAKNYSPEQLCQTISEHIGIKVEKYILFNFGHVQSIIDALGGVDITIDSAEASYLTRYAISPTSTTPSVRGAGTYHFGGHAAVIYMRIRKAGHGGDFMRTQRVRTVLSTLADSCRDISLDQAYELCNVVLEHSSRTNMTLKDLRDAAAIAYDLRGCTIEELRIPQDGDVRTMSNYSQVIDWPATRDKLKDFLRNSFLVIDDDEDEE